MQAQDRRGRAGWFALAAAALFVLGVIVTVGSCGDDDEPFLPALGYPCSPTFHLCEPGLICNARDYCTKTCRCESDGGSVCTPDNFAAGCPQYAVCVVVQEDGRGECHRRCRVDLGPCAPGEGECAQSPEGTWACAGDAFLPARDAGAPGDGS